MHSPLVLEGVTRRYAGKAVVEDVSLALAPGEITALLGGSGAGKSTLLRLIAGLEPIDAGRIHTGLGVLSEPGRTVPPEKRGIGLIFQDFALFPHLTAARNVAFGLKGLRPEEIEQRVSYWMDLLGLKSRANAYPHELSGGEQQRVAIARALAPGPAAILMDEPFSGLDPALSGSVRDAALAAIRAAGIPALMVTHDPVEALEHADRIAILRQGHLLQSGTPDEVYRHPQSLAVARALGGVNLIERAALPDVWKPAAGALLGVRPEGVIPDAAAPVRMQVVSRRLAGPLVRLDLAGSGLSLQALVPHASPLQPGEETGVRLDPALMFTFASAQT